MVSMVGVAIVSAALVALAIPQCREHWFLAAHYWGKSSNIEFYGRVVDQDAKPVADAIVSVAISTFNPATLTGGKEYLKEQRMTVVTDASGEFKVTGVSGAVLNIEKISHPQYVTIPEVKWRAGMFEAFGYGYWRERGVPYYVPDPRNPAVFPLWKQGQPRTLMPSRGGRDEPNQ